MRLSKKTVGLFCVFCSPLQAHIECAAVTEKIAALKRPKRDGQCNWLEEGAAIYANLAEPDALYVQCENPKYDYYFTVNE